jgi:hypothetical protein
MRESAERSSASYWKRLGLSTRGANALACAGIDDLSGLRNARGRLASIPNIGEVTRQEIERLLERYRAEDP